MALIVGVGSSIKTDSKIASEEAFYKATQKLGQNSPSFILLLASPTTYNQQDLLTNLYGLSPQSLLIGCSTSGEITNSGPVDNSIAMMAIYSDSIKFIPGCGKDIKNDPRTAGLTFAKDLLKNSGGVTPKTAIILPDGLSGNGADIVRGILDSFGQNFMLAGGSAGDDFLFKQTYQYYNKEVLTNSIVGVGLSGIFNFGIGVKHGWIPIGTSRKVTKAESNILYELDGKPAISIYDDHFGKDKTLIKKDEPFARSAITYPLGIVLEGKNEYLIRDPLSVDQNGAIICAAEIPLNSEVYLMIGSSEEAIIAAEQAAKDALNQLHGNKPKAAILFNCIARKKLLMNKKKEEIDKIQNIIGQDVPLIGFYTYGEQAPLENQIVSCSFHNETDVLFLLAE